MLPGAVAIDVPEQTPSVWMEAATKACSAALGEGRCIGDGSENPAWRARISHDPDSTTLRVALYAADSDTPESMRRLHFRDVDPERQRWASAGVVVAAMVSASEAGREGAPLSSPEVEALRLPVPEAVPSARDPASEQARLWFDIGAAAANGVQGELPAFGAGLEGTFRPFVTSDALGVLFNVGGSATWAERPFASRWMTMAAGVGYRVVDAGPVWDVVLEGRGQHYAVEVTRGPVPRTESGADVRFGMALDTRLAFDLADRLQGFVGVSSALYFEEIDIEAEFQLIGRVPPFAFGMDAGIRWNALR